MGPPFLPSHAHKNRGSLHVTLFILPSYPLTRTKTEALFTSLSSSSLPTLSRAQKQRLSSRHSLLPPFLPSHAHKKRGREREREKAHLPARVLLLLGKELQKGSVDKVEPVHLGLPGTGPQQLLVQELACPDGDGTSCN